MQENSMNSLETSLKKAMKIEDLAMEIAGHTHRHELEHLTTQQILDDTYIITYIDQLERRYPL